MVLAQEVRKIHIGAANMILQSWPQEAGECAGFGVDFCHGQEGDDKKKSQSSFGLGILRRASTAPSAAKALRVVIGSEAWVRRWCDCDIGERGEQGERGPI